MGRRLVGTSSERYRTAGDPDGISLNRKRESPRPRASFHR
jgi:hypothetical protein